ncbi:hypothetical protein ACOMHN_058008 [Nucella lapillus]
MICGTLSRQLVFRSEIVFHKESFTKGHSVKRTKARTAFNNPAIGHIAQGSHADTHSEMTAVSLPRSLPPCGRPRRADSPPLILQASTVFDVPDTARSYLLPSTAPGPEFFDPPAAFITSPSVGLSDRLYLPPTPLIGAVSTWGLLFLTL